MASTKYTYSINGDFPYSKVDLTRLSSEINGSDISTTLEYVSTNADDCDIWFVDALSGIDSTSLIAIVLEHSGEPFPPVPSEYIVTAGEDLGSRKAAYISGLNEVKLACANSEDTLPCVGFTEDTADSASEVTIWTNDVLDGFTDLTPGEEYYLSQDSTAAGEITLVKPTGIIVSVGVAKTTTELDIHLQRRAAGGVFGSEYQVVESDGLSSITGTIALQEKLRLDVIDLPLGKYRLSWNFDWLYSNTNNSFQARIEMDDYFIFYFMMTQEPQDASNEYNESGFNILTDFSGTHHFDLDYRTLNASHTAKILSARLEIWRVE